MFDRRVAVSGLILGIVLSACAAAAQMTKPITQPLPKLSGDWTINMTQSGGIMGMLRTIEIRSDGKTHIENQHGNKRSLDRELSAEQVKQLANLVNSLKLTTSNKPNGACADCFIYDLQVTANDQTFSTQLNDINLSDSGLGPLVEFLGQLMDQLLA